MNKIHNADALTILPSIKTDSIDMILTDPPYNTTSLKMDKQSFDLNNYMPEFKRILKPNGWLFCFGTFEMATLITNYAFKLKFDYVWVKPQGTPKSYNTIRPHRQHELILVFINSGCKPTSLYYDPKVLRTPGTKYRRVVKSTTNPTEFRKTQRIAAKSAIVENTGYREGTTILYYPAKNTLPKTERTAHPTQKPLALCELLCKGYCPKDGLVLDPFCGSGTIPLAAKTSNRKYIGIEINPKYYKMAYDRIHGTL